MFDAIDKAVNLTKQKNSLLNDKLLNKNITENIKVPQNLQDKINKLPLQKDPRLIALEKEAEVLEKKAEVERKIELAKEFTLSDAKDKAFELGQSFLPTIPAIPAIPLVDPRLLAWLAYIKLKEQLKKAKQMVSKQNLKRSTEVFKYPLKPNKSLTELPSVPNLPTIPQIPKIPTLPQIPSFEVPKLPTINLPNP